MFGNFFNKLSGEQQQNANQSGENPPIHTTTNTTTTTATGETTQQTQQGKGGRQRETRGDYCTFELVVNGRGTPGSEKTTRK